MTAILRRASLLFTFGISLLALNAACTRTEAPAASSGEAPEDAEQESGPLDLSQPVPREQVLDLFKQLFALPAEDYLYWKEAGAAGRIPEDVRAFQENIITFNKETVLAPEDLSTEGLPSVDLPDGPRVYPVLKATLPPAIGAEISQEDLNSLLPELADLQQRIWKFEEEEARKAEVFTKAQLKADDLTIALVKDAASENTVTVVVPGEKEGSLHVRMPALLDGRHVKGVRMATKPFVSLHIELTDEGSELLGKVTAEHAGKIFAILIGGEYHAAVAVGGKMETQHLQLPGRLGEEEAVALLQSWTNGGAVEDADLKKAKGEVTEL